MPETTRRRWITVLAVPALLLWGAAAAVAAVPPLDAAVPTLDPLTIPKYADPLIIPPAMPPAPANPTASDYEIAVRQFDQFILPQSMGMTTTVWSYGDVNTPGTVAGGGSFNYPALTVENQVGVPTRVRWINDLVDSNGDPLPHLLGDVVDQTLHWANPNLGPCMDGTVRTDCRGTSAVPYTGPVPIVTHVHGAHVGPESDGYPEAWWLPAGAPAGYATGGTLFDDFLGTPAGLGYAVYQYPNTMRDTTLWYHDHTLGMTRLNVYAGPAGFWLIRGAEEAAMGFPGIAPQLGDLPVQDLANGVNYFEMPIVIQDRSFNADGSLFYPDNRAFFEGLANLEDGNPGGFPYLPDPASDISPIWNPEAFFNTMVVNGRTWPYVDVDRSTYRLRLLDGCNSRFLILKMVYLDPAGNGDPNDPANWVDLTNEFKQIGADGGFLPRVRAKDEILMAPAERADVLVNFRAINGQLNRAGIPVADRQVYLVNVGPDDPFGGGVPGVDFPAADPATTGQVMQFRINPGVTYTYSTRNADLNALLPPTDPLVVRAGRQYVDPVSGAPVAVQTLSLNEEISGKLCVEFTATAIIDQTANVPGLIPGSATFEADCTAAGFEPMGPKAALLGTWDPVAKLTTPLLWADPTTENPRLGDTQVWEVYNFTADAHPIHLHLVQYQLLDRQLLDPVTWDPVPGTRVRALPEERGMKDTAIMYPGDVTRLAAHFDIAGLYVWHCHIVEHEDNEMMRPYLVKYIDDLDGDGRVNLADLRILIAVLRDHLRNPSLSNMHYDLNGDNVLDTVDLYVLLSRWTG